jgi:dienelactone hydrolase
LSPFLVAYVSGGEPLVASGESPASRRPAPNETQTPPFDGKVLLGGKAYRDVFERQLRLLWQEYWQEDGDWKGDMMNDATAFAPQLLFQLYRETEDEQFYERAVATCRYQQRLAHGYLQGKRKPDVEMLLGFYSALPYMQHVKAEEERDRTRLMLRNLLATLAHGLSDTEIEGDESFVEALVLALMDALRADVELSKVTLRQWRSKLTLLCAWATLEFCELSQDRGLLKQAEELIDKYDRANFDAAKGRLTWTYSESLRMEAGVAFMAYAKMYVLTGEQKYLDRANEIIRSLRRNKILAGVFFDYAHVSVGEAHLYLSTIMLYVEGFGELYRATGRQEYRDALRRALDFAVSEMQLSKVYPAGIEDPWFGGERRVVPFFAHHIEGKDGDNVVSPDYCVGCNLMMLSHIWNYHHERPESETRKPADPSPLETDARDKTEPADRSLPPVHEITVDGIPSYYTYSNLDSDSRKGLPAIIVLGHPKGKRENVQRFAEKFAEPVLLIWCGLLRDLHGDTSLEDKVVWRRKRLDFVKRYGRYKEHLGFDPNRVYLTGFSFFGAYAWMLAYDRPDLYAGVVAMSAVSYPEQIQKTLKSGESVVTVVVRGENDAGLARRLAQEEETGRAIESRNPHSRFVVKPGEDHRGVADDWLEHLDYVLQFSKAD